MRSLVMSLFSRDLLVNYIRYLQCLNLVNNYLLEYSIIIIIIIIIIIVIINFVRQMTGSHKRITFKRALRNIRGYKYIHITNKLST